MPSDASEDADEVEHEPVEVPADDGKDWREIDDCEGCGYDGSALRAIKMRRGRRRLLCLACFTQELDRGTVSPSDPRVEEHGYGGGEYA